jgi:formylglycine-generating enzyme required for sulfatase activity
MKGDVSPLGVFDLGGNVREWCREGAGITVSGGSWSSDEGAARVDFTPRRRPGGGGDDKTGFRVVMEVAE